MAGPFTVESLSPHRVLGVGEDDELLDRVAEARAGYNATQNFDQIILANLKTSGVQQAHKDDKIDFTHLEPWPGRFVCAEGRYPEGGETGREKRAAVFVGPEFGTVSRPDLVEAAREAADAGFDVLIACAFNYDAQSSELNKLGRIPILKARMNADLHMADDLKNTGKGNLFVIFGEPDMDILNEESNEIRVHIKGVDVFHPNTGEIRSDGPGGIACWFIDTDYNEESFFVRQAYFLGRNDPYKSLQNHPQGRNQRGCLEYAQQRHLAPLPETGIRPHRRQGHQPSGRRGDEGVARMSYVQFVKDGPYLPERMLYAHEEGRVVFFCGAGISYPAGLPGFEDLVNQLYDQLADERNSAQRAAIRTKQFDKAIELLESRLVCGREIVRKELPRILSPKRITPKATATHNALLTLSQDREGNTRLVTTNFDRIFEDVVETRNLSVERCEAPRLPIPKRRWSGLVYLHGLLSDEPTDDELNQLVLSSGDFGLAYLSEGWAARFMSELFRNFTVCFVGYSIEDPVLRYMTDALAADRILGENPHKVFAFGSCSKGQEERIEAEWEAKNVIPILYRKHNRHAHLHKTLHEWAKTYSDGVLAKEHIIAKHAVSHPLANTKEDNFASRVLWALSDPSGVPARRFAELNPVPSLDWLDELDKARYGYADLPQFGIHSDSIEDENLKFSLLDRPSPYTLATRMTVADHGPERSDWDKVMHQLAHWLTRHLNDPKLLLWLVSQGGQLHENLALLIEQDDEAGEIPDAAMQKLWGLLLAGRTKSPDQRLDFQSWQKRFKREGPTVVLRLELRELLTPRVLLRPLFPWSAETGENSGARRIRDLVRWEIRLVANHVHSEVDQLRKEDRWTDALPKLLPDFIALLRDTLDLMDELDEGEGGCAPSFIEQPSISEHDQNLRNHDWTALIDLTRDAWMETAKQSPEQARCVAESWWNHPHMLFRRLALFAAAQGDIIPPHLGLDWLLADGRQWLWSRETRREAVRLIVKLAPQLDEPMWRELGDAIVYGPSDESRSSSADPERRKIFAEREIWLRLAKAAASRGKLSPPAEDKLNELAGQHPNWMLKSDENDEFSFWTGLFEEDADEGLPDSLADVWRERCSDNFEETTRVLSDLAKVNKWPDTYWGCALQAWSQEKLRTPSWGLMAPIVEHMPTEVLQLLAGNISHWLDKIAKNPEPHQAIFIALCRRILELGDLDGKVPTDDFVTQAINHPVGHVTEALLQRLPEDAQCLPEDIKSIFTEICDLKVPRFLHGRVVLASRVVPLFCADESWTRTHLLPLFDWQDFASEAPAMWQGFLWPAHMYPPLMEILEPAFLQTAGHYDKLGNSGSRYVYLLAFAALDQSSFFNKSELRRATRALPQKGLCETADALVSALESTDGPDQRAAFWENRIDPYIHRIWPKDRTEIEPEIAKQISENFARLCIAAGEKFPDAVDRLEPWLQPVLLVDGLLRQLSEAELCRKFPRGSLKLMARILGDNPRWLSASDLGPCLKDLCTAEPEIKNDHRYKKLKKILRQLGGNADDTD